MENIKLYRPNNASEKYGKVLGIDQRGNQVIVDILNLKILVNEKPYTLNEWLGKLASQVEYQKRDYEKQVKELKEFIDRELEKQREININLIKAIREGDVL